MLLVPRLFLRCLLVLGLVLLLPGLAFAQGDDGGFTLGWRELVAGLISGTLVPLAVQLLIFFYPLAPTWLKGIAGPVIVPALTLGALLLSNALGFAIDFGPIIAILLGAGGASSLAFRLGKNKGLRKR